MDVRLHATDLGIVARGNLSDLHDLRALSKILLTVLILEDPSA
jgi:hypothetical protein